MAPLQLPVFSAHNDRNSCIFNASFHITIRLSVDADLACIRAVVKSLDGSTRAALVSFLRGTALGSLAQVLSGSAATQP